MKIIKSEKGFTLVELLLVMAIIGILAGIIFISIGPARKRARITAFKKVMQDVSTAATLCADGAGVVETAASDGAESICGTEGIVGNVPKITSCKGGAGNIGNLVVTGEGDDFKIKATCPVTGDSVKCYAVCDMNGCVFGNADGGNNGCTQIKEDSTPPATPPATP